MTSRLNFQPSKKDNDVECILKDETEPTKERSHSLEQSEEKIEGTVSFDIYGYYIKMTGYILSFIITLSLIIMQGSKTLTDWYLVYWIHQDKENRFRFYQSFVQVFEGILFSRTNSNGRYRINLWLRV